MTATTYYIECNGNLYKTSSADIAEMYSNMDYRVTAETRGDA